MLSNTVLSYLQNGQSKKMKIKDASFSPFFYVEYQVIVKPFVLMI